MEIDGGSFKFAYFIGERRGVFFINMSENWLRYILNEVKRRSLIRHNS